MHVFRRPYDYAVRNGLRRVGFRTSPLEPPVAVESEAVLSSAWGAQKTSIASVYDENLAESSLASSDLMEWTAEKIFTSSVLVDNLRQQQVEGQAPVDWQGSISVNADHSVNLEWLGSNISGRSIHLDWLKTLSTESDIQSDWQKTQTYANTFQFSNLMQQKITGVVPAEWQGALSIVVDSPFELEWLTTNVSGIYIPSGWLKSLSTDSDVRPDWQQRLTGIGNNLIEYLAERQTSSLVPIGWTGALAVTTSHHINAEWRKTFTSEGLVIFGHLIQTAPASKSALAYLQSISTISKTPIGWTAAEIFSSESVLPVSWANQMDFGEPVKVEFAAGLSAEQKQAVEWLTRVGLTQEMIIAHGVVVTTVADISVEWSGGDVVFVQGNANIWCVDKRGHVWCVPTTRGHLWN